MVVSLMKVLIAMDKFKGSASAKEAGEAVARALHRLQPGWEITVCGIADGGEGTAAALVDATGGGWLEAPVHDAQHRPITARYGWLPGSVAVMEMSAASGLSLVADLPLDPLRASTFGTGEMMRHAIGQGARKILIGIGGSATNDGGIGMAQALGFQFDDANGLPVTDLPAQCERIAKIRPPTGSFPEIIVACDVDNPLLGPRGASAVYGPQKGVEDIAFFERRLEHLAALARRDLGADVAEVPGSGAAGGLGFGLLAFCSARLMPGFDLVAEALQLETLISRTELLITGEGRLDSQSLCGKGPVGVARMARRHGAKVIGIAGTIQDRQALASDFDLLIQTKPETMPLEEAIRRGATLIEESVAHHGEEIGMTKGR